MLGEIIKSTEALRYHAKTAEIAGQNLAHVNDETYARQRVLSREGLMSKGQGGLNVGSLQAGGLEHARNELLDKRVFAEFSESANLETQKEILSLLQAALGESIDRQSISGGLGNDYESNLAAGGLARALDDLFNAFQELSASPDEATAKEEIVNKIKTLTKRFNDAGSAIDEIDADISSSVEKSVGTVNGLLEQIYEVNLQVKRFELLGQGQAVTYRDQRQKLLEDLSKLINFNVDRELRQFTTKDYEAGDEFSYNNSLYRVTQKIDSGSELFIDKSTGEISSRSIIGNLQSIATKLVQEEVTNTEDLSLTSKETGFWNITTYDHQNQVVDLVSSKQGVASLSKDFGKLIILDNPAGANAQVQAKISSDGSLGHIEVLDGGSQFDDTDGPILFSVFPSLTNSTVDNTGFAQSAHLQGDVFSQEGKLYQALSDTLAGTSLTDKNQFMEIINTPANGVVFPESLRKYSDIENFAEGDQIYYEGKLYQAREAVGSFSDLKLNDANQTTNNLFKGEVVQFNNQFFQVLKNLESGTNVNALRLSELRVGEEIDGLVSLGQTPPKSVSELAYTPSVIDASRPDRWFLSKSYKAGDIVKYKDKFLEFTQDVYRGSELDELSKAMQSLTYDQTRSYSVGDFVELGGSYYKFTGDVSAFAADTTVAENLSEVIGNNENPFDGLVQVVEDPNRNFIHENGSFKLSESFREYELSGLSGSEQTKQIRISGITGDESDVFNFKITLNGETVKFDNDLESENSFTITGFNNQFSQNLKNKLLEISSDGNAISGSISNNPAFEILVDDDREDGTKDLLISGVGGLGDFSIEVSTENLAPQDQGVDVIPVISTDNVVREYIADQFNFVFSSESFEDVSLKTSYKGNSDKTAESIVQAVADDEVLSQFISASTTNGQVYFRAKEQDFEFSVKLADTNGLEDLHNDLTNQTKISTTNNSVPTSELIQEAFEGVPVSTTLNNFAGLEVVQKSEIVFPGQFGEATAGVDYGDEITLNLELGGNIIEIKIDESPGRTLEELISQTEETLLAVEQDGTFQEGVPAVNPAFILTSAVTTWRNDIAGAIGIHGAPGLGNFDLSAISDNISVKLIEEYSSDDYNLVIEGQNGDLGSISIPFQGNEADTVEAIKEAINNNEILNKEVIAVAQGTELLVTGLTPESDFTNIRWNIEGELAPQTVAFNGVPQPSSKQTVEIGNLDGVEQVQKSSIQFNAGPGSEEINTFTISINGVDVPLELPAGNGDPQDLSRFESLENALKSINRDGSTTVDGSASNNPALEVTFLGESQTFLLSGNLNTGRFDIDVDTAPSLVTETFQDFISDDFKIDILDENGQNVGTVVVPAKTDAIQNANAIVAAINNNENIAGVLNASLSVDGLSVLLESLDTQTIFTANVSTDDNFNEFTVTATTDLDQSTVANVQSSGPKISRIEKTGVGAVGLVTATAQQLDFKKQEDPMIFQQNDLFYFNGDDGELIHFVVTAPTGEIDPTEFDPLDAQWEDNFRIFKPKLVSEDDPSVIFRKAFPVGHNLDNGSLVELNIGLAEAVVKKGEIVGFNIINNGNGLPSTDAVFVNGQELLIDSGSIKGYQEARSTHLESFRTELNTLVSSFVEEINSIYNPDDSPGAYIFGFDAVLTRPVSGSNLLMEEEYGYFGREGDASITLYRDEVNMTLPTANSEDFTIVNTTPIFPEEFTGNTSFYRGGDLAETTFRADDAGDLISFYASASRMQNVTMENDEAYPGADQIVGTEDDGRSFMMAYEAIPFRVEGLEEGAKLPIIGDNFTFSALPSNPWNLATSLNVDHRFSSDSLLTGHSSVNGSNEVALAIAEIGEGSYIEKVALLNANMGNTISDLKDNIDHQKSIETLLLDQRRAVSSVSIDEEVADLMRFQRSFQASSRVLSTLDKMLEIVVMGLVR